MSRERTEALQKARRLLHNKQVRNYFRDVDETNERDLSPRTSAKRLLLLEDNDSLIYQREAIEFFKDYCLDENGLANEYFSVPITTFNQSLKYAPQVTLYFVQILTNTESANRVRAKTMEVSFRVRESKMPATKSGLRPLANEIRTKFATPSYRFQKGGIICSYYQPELGYEFKIYADDETDARQLIKDVMGLLDDTDKYEERIFKPRKPVEGTGSDPTPATPERVRIFGDLVDLPVFGQKFRVGFTRATMTVYPQKPFYLVKGDTVLV